MFGRAGLPTIVCLVLCSGVAGWAEEQGHPVAEADGTSAREFPRPPELMERVRFWTKIFTAYSAHQAILHDRKHIGKIYAILELDPESEFRNKEIVEEEKKRIGAALLRIHNLQDNPAALSAGDLKLFTLFRDVKEPDKFRAAAERIRAQTGLRERFRDGIGVSRRYIPEMARIFRRAGLPVELTRLPLIESTFDVTAYSRVGAAGIWQFMPATGRFYGLRVDRLIDERRDPLLATEAAARYLADAHDRLGSWPLAITAYNHGPQGIARATQALGTTSIVALVERYDGQSFGFAGQNFYAEFLAALDVDREPERHLGTLVYEEPLAAEEVEAPHAADINVVAQAAGVSVDRVAALNPALGSEIVTGSVDVPEGYPMRIPAGTKVAFERSIAALGGRRQGRVARSGRHTVGRGQTLSQIAARHGVSTDALKRYNGIGNADVVRVGQVLRIPPKGTSPRPVSRSRVVTHRVRHGQTLSHIAEQYGTSVQALKRQNGISNAGKVRAGQVLKIPTS
jgi:membrane-bound lytic murein transglycosylase D